MKKFLTSLGIVSPLLAANSAFAAQPRDWEWTFQPPATPIMHQIEWFNAYTLWFIIPITLLVMGLLGYCIVRFRETNNPTPSRTSHNTLIEILWTIGPVVILLFIAVPSFQLLTAQYTPPEEPQMTIKATGVQWYWEYEYPRDGKIYQASANADASANANDGQNQSADQSGAEEDQSGAEEQADTGSQDQVEGAADSESEGQDEGEGQQQAAAEGEEQSAPEPVSFSSLIVQSQEDRADLGKDDLSKYPRLLTVDNEMVVPIDTTIRLQVTGSDVIHSFAMPAFGLKVDAVPGRVQEAWFKAQKEGLYYGQCSELCGQGHAFMPIAIRVVGKEQYQTWISAAADDVGKANQDLMASIANNKGSDKKVASAQ